MTSKRASRGNTATPRGYGMRSYAAVFGHPIHPMLVVVPIGLYVWTFAADILYLLSGRDMMWYDIAFWTGLAAIVTAAVAAIPGFIDYLMLARGRAVQRMAQAHMVLNIVVLLLFFIAMLLMIDEGAAGGFELGLVVVLHGVGVGLLALAGVLGGELVYRKHLAVIPREE